MGREHTCEGSFNGERGEGKALLETDEVIFRGAFRARVKFNAVTSIGSSWRIVAEDRRRHTDALSR